jgi:hypothetical protein
MASPNEDLTPFPLRSIPLHLLWTVSLRVSVATLTLQCPPNSFQSGEILLIYKFHHARPLLNPFLGFPLVLMSQTLKGVSPALGISHVLRA